MTPKRIAELKATATDFLEGRLQPLEAALALAAFEDEASDKLKKALTAMVGVVSETDDIPLGERRALWHPDVRAREDQRHDEAQACAKLIVRKTCGRVLAILEAKPKTGRMPSRPAQTAP